MLDIIQIRDHAIKTADEGKGKEACPFAETSAHGRLWLDYFYDRVMWLSGEQSA
jgi:hypothetical protein